MAFTLRVLYGARQSSPSCVWYYVGKVGEWRDLYFYCWIIRDEKHNIIVDTGVPFNKPEDFDILNRSHQYVDEKCVHPREHVVPPEDALASIGLSCKDFDKVLITSTSSYATGNIELFQNADVYISKLGWENVAGRDEMGIYEPRVFFPAETMAYLRGPGKSKLHLVDDEEICSGLRFWWTGAHHRGSMAVSVKTKKGLVNFGDMAFVYENLEEKRPIGVLESMKEWLDSYPRLMAADIVLPIHDSRIFQRYPDGVIA